MPIIKLKSFRENLETYRKRINAGESFIVIRRSEPIFKVSPVEADSWEEVIDFTKIRKGGVEIQEILKRL